MTGLIENLKTWTARDYQTYGWALMAASKCADLAVTWYALTTMPTFIEGNPIPAMAYNQLGMLGLVVLNGAAIVLLTVVVEVGVTHLRRHDAGERAIQSAVILGYWLPGVVWLIISYSNYSMVRQAQTTLGF